MRVKQTARKSTASRPSLAPSSSRLGWTPVVKRESAGNRGSATTTGSSASYSTRVPPGQKTIPPRESERDSRDRSANPMENRLNSLLRTKRSQGDVSSSSYQFSPRNKKTLVKIKPRSRVGEQALREIHNLQKMTDLLIPRAAFGRVVREITQELMKSRPADDQPIRYQTAALEALQEAAESHLVQLMEDAYMCTIHAKRVTLFASDIQLVLRLQFRGLY